MTKLYKCAKGCGSIEETDEEQVPVCCGVPMIEITEEELSGCGGCCSCCHGCGMPEEEEKPAEPAGK